MIRYFRIVFLSFIFCFIFSFTTKAEITEKWWDTYPNRSGKAISYNTYPSGNTFWEYNLSAPDNQFIFNLTNDRGVPTTYVYFFTNTPTSSVNLLLTEMAYDDSGNISTAPRASSSVDNYLSLSSEVLSSLSGCTVYRGSVLRSSGENLIYDFRGTWAELDEYIKNGGEYKPPFDPDDVYSDLPSLTYTLSFNAYTALSFPPLRYNGYLKWDFNEKSPYSSSPNNFIYDVRFADTSESSVSDIDNERVYKLDSGPLVNNESSFSCYDLQKKIQSLNFRHDDLCIILVRAVTLDGKHASPYTAFSLNFGNFGHPNAYHTNAYYDNNFNHSGNDGTDGVVDDTTGKDSSDTETSAGKNPDSDIYKNPSSNSKLDTSDAINGLKSAISSVTEIINLLALVYSWFPGWLISLISISVALLVIVGLIKLIIS